MTRIQLNKYKLRNTACSILGARNKNMNKIYPVLKNLVEKLAFR